MNLNEPNTFYGVPDGIFYAKYDRLETFNDRISDRFVPDTPLEPNYDPLPVSSKYAVFPILDGRKPATEERRKPYLDYYVEMNFNPATQRGPVSGYINNVDVETVLQNQTFARQRGLGQHLYVPSSTSELYKTVVPSRPSVQPCPLLFVEPQFEDRVHPNLASSSQLGTSLFFNNTRIQR